MVQSTIVYAAVYAEFKVDDAVLTAALDLFC
jgi:hypothetical protein